MYVISVHVVSVREKQFPLLLQLRFTNLDQTYTANRQEPEISCLSLPHNCLLLNGNENKLLGYNYNAGWKLVGGRGQPTLAAWWMYPASHQSLVHSQLQLFTVAGPKQQMSWLNKTCMHLPKLQLMYTPTNIDFLKDFRLKKTIICYFYILMFGLHCTCQKQ